MRLLFAVPLLLGRCLAGQASDLAGIVVDDGGKPLEGVHVRLVETGQGSVIAARAAYGAVSDSNGGFRLASPRSGIYLVFAERAGLIQQSSTSSAPLTVKPGERLSGYRITMAECAVIAGRVADEYGDPVQGITVQAQSAAGDASAQFLAAGPAAQTDDRGEFRLVTGPGSYYLAASRRARADGPPEIRTDGTPGGPFGTTYYPSAVTAGAASVIQVAAGQDLEGAEIRLLRTGVGETGAFRISGVVGGAPRGGRATVFLSRAEATRQNPGFRAIRAGEDGAFSFPAMPPGAYSIAASYSSGGVVLHSRAVDLRLESADEIAIELALLPGEELVGQLRIAGGGPAVELERYTVRLQAGGGLTDVSRGEVPAARGRVGRLVPG
jgi:hypothetical protein